MTGAATTAGFNSAAFEAFRKNRDEPDWLQKMRQESWDAFCQMDWPARNSEEWQRTDIRLFKLDRFALPASPPVATDLPASLLSADVELAGEAVSLDSYGVRSHLANKWREKGVLFGSLDELVHQHGDLVRKHLFARAANPHFDKFAALHGACWSGGHLLYVPRNVVVDEPLLSMSALSDGGVDLGHTLVILEEGAEATLLSEKTSGEESAGGLHCGALEVLQGAGSRLRFVHLQNWGRGVWHFAHQKAILERNASLQWTAAALGSRLSKVNQHVDLAGPGAECDVNGVMFTEGKQHLSYHTQQRHIAPGCRSNFLYKSALQGASRTVWRGMIRVDKDAQQTNGYQRNDNLLLSDSCRADSIPGLQIEADDVRCTHGSTSGRVDEELIFYACCRGYTRQEAIRAIVIGFFQQVFDRITIESVREALGQAIARRVQDYE